VFLTRPIAASFVGISALLVLVQVVAWWRKRRLLPPMPRATGDTQELLSE
jgi:hypothetical protein